VYSDKMKTFYQHCSDTGSTANAKIKFCKDDLKFVLDLAVAAEQEKEEAMAKQEARAKKDADKEATTASKKTPTKKSA